MASASLAPPGTEYGPCEEPCQHTDCAATREMAESKCVRCGEPIGFDVSFFSEDADLAHARCVYRALEKAMA